MGIYCEKPYGLLEEPIHVCAGRERTCPGRKMVLRERIELSTSPLPRECSTTELPQHRRECGGFCHNIAQTASKQSGFFLHIVRILHRRVSRALFLGPILM